MTVSRASFLLWALQCLERRVPYVWGGRDPAVGLDCSGFVTVPLFQLSMGKLDFRFTHNTDLLWKELPHVNPGQEAAGDVAVYRGANSTGPADVEHVMVYLGHGLVVGQAVGGRANTSAAYSIERRHWTKALRQDYRPDLAGFVRLPLLP